MNRYSKILTACLLIAFVSVDSVNAQKTDSTKRKIVPRNMLYFEILGTSGGILSINYERLKKENISLRGGIGLTNFFSTELVSVPFSVSYITQGKKRPDLEMGYGMSLLLVNGNPGIFTGPVIGFRDYNRSKPGLVIRVVFTPSLYLVTGYDIAFVPMGGLSMGLSY